MKCAHTHTRKSCDASQWSAGLKKKLSVICWNFVVLTQNGKTALGPSLNLVMMEKAGFLLETKAKHLVKFMYDTDFFLHGKNYQNIQTGLLLQI